MALPLNDLLTAEPVHDFSEDDLEFLPLNDAIFNDLLTAEPVRDFSKDEIAFLESITNSAPEFIFKIIEEPQEKFNFCYKSKKKTYLRGRTTSKGKLKTYPKVALHFPSSESTIKELFARCTLHQVPAIAEESSCISPHLLWRRSDDDYKVHTSENKYFPFTKEAPNLHTFTLEEFVILSTARKHWLEVIKYKLRMQNLDLSGEQEKEYERIADKLMCKPQDKVRLCFEVFEKHDNNSYVRIAGPFYSQSISNGQAPYIDTITQNRGYINEITEVTLLVAPVKPNDRIIISETKYDISADEQDNENAEFLWKAIIPLQVVMLNNKKAATAITFKMPIYGGRKYNLERITCKIQLERVSDGALSNVKNYEYINLKRRYNNSNTNENDNGLFNCN